MTLNKSKGNMYPFVTHTWNAINGKCMHNCTYCYMKVYKLPELHLSEKSLKNDLGRNNFIFVGSSCDMWADNVPDEWIIKVLRHCKDFPENTYLFQSKNPKRFVKFRDELISMNCVLGTTMETNRQRLLDGLSKAPSIWERSDAMTIKGFRKMITLEPIMDFDVPLLVGEIERTNPEWVNIGADSKGHNLPEPSVFKIELLVNELMRFTRVKIKDNLKRIVVMGDKDEQRA